MVLNGSGEGRTDESRDDLGDIGNLLGRKWYLPVIDQIQESGSMGFNELKRELADISSKVLSETLKQLEERALVEREMVSDKPFRVEYSLTERGDSLEGVIGVIHDWYADGRAIAVCDGCGDTLVDDRTCSYCSDSYCPAHRLPESHDCPGIE
ncbi:winged helix-turn-helix transcriptional regulator [Halomarina litorea]|uniref:winged helix-turn-helix transcriptional regulator n=1 Tax=Halomarina litorea TaxID=2961595 RepID=UPI0020C42BB9|nr:winged helix-turn-helix transcriptional regulator [Halomarina sp. BCD28]